MENILGLGRTAVGSDYFAKLHGRRNDDDGVVRRESRKFTCLNDNDRFSFIF